MAEHPIRSIAGLTSDEQAVLLELNNAHARETSFLTPQKWQAMIANAFAADCVGGTASLLIAFDQDADYYSANFIWFRNRFDKFVYVDRIVVGSEHRGAGLARKLYENLFRRATDSSHDVVVCEVNRVPPNPGSDAFHASMDFIEIGQAVLADGEKTVRYLRKSLS